MKRLASISLLVLFLAPLAAGQPHGTDLLVSDDQGQILRVRPGGAVNTVGKFTNGFLSMLAIDCDNRHVAAVHSPFLTPGAVLRIDPVTQVVVTTVWAGAPLPSTLSWIEVDQDGDYVVLAGGLFSAAVLLHIKRDGSAVRTLYGGTTTNLVSCFTEDKTSGDWIIGDQGNVGSISRVDRDTGLLTTLIWLPNTGRYAFGMAQDPQRPDIYVTRVGETTRYDPLTNTVSRLGATGAECVAADRSPAPNGALLYVASSGSMTGGTLERMDRFGTNLGVVATIASAPMGITFDRSRNLGPMLRTAPNDRLIRVSFPGDGGKAFVLALSLSGYTPGIGLPDGRVIPLNADSLTFLTAWRELAPLLTNNIGRLNASGEAIVNFDVNALGGAVKGIRVWAAAVSLDHGAPFGISRISAPFLFVL